jgi:ABC-type multidrug transport system ATPase subunit
MNINFQKAGKRFNREWIFRNLSMQLEHGSKTAVLGGNGSGKSTFLKTCSAYHTLNEGEVEYSIHGSIIPPEKVFEQLSMAAPYMDLPGLFTLRETLEFHFKLKKTTKGLGIDEILSKSGLEQHQNKAIGKFSSGMKQRVKLLLAICTESNLLLIDEPSTNLDREGTAWYLGLMEEFSGERTVVIASNHYEDEYQFCETTVDIRNFK